MLNDPAAGLPATCLQQIGEQYAPVQGASPEEGKAPEQGRKKQADGQTALPPEVLLKPMEIKRLARVPYSTVIGWLTVGHPSAGVLPSIDLGGTGKRHSYRIRKEDWEAFLARLQTVPRERQQASPLPRPQSVPKGAKKFHY